jgi:hypothetical protein
MNRLLRKPLAVALMSAGSFATVAHADVKLPAIISDHMVLQQDVAAPVWGWAEPGEEVTVAIAGQSQTTKADADGKWMVKLAKLKTMAEPQTLTVKGKNTKTVQDVLVGEVWLASGQSNMAFMVDRGRDAEAEKAAAKFPQIRMFITAGNPQRTPQVDCKGAWKVCAPETVGTFSAVAYFFGRDLHQKLGGPVGLVHSSVGGTDIAAWTSEEVQMKDPDLKAFFDSWVQREATYDPAAAKAVAAKQLAAWEKNAAKAKEEGKPAPAKPRATKAPQSDPNFPASLYNGMIAPLIPYGVRGFIWYQGEHNTATDEKALRYRRQLPLLVNDWRTRWGAELPFAWVQLPGLERAGEGRPLVREAMLAALKLPKTGMAITVDVGEPTDNHPKNKQDVGHRLALWALGTVYGQKVPATSGPLPAGVEAGNGKVVVKFSHTDGGLVAQGGDVKGFLIAGADKQWVKANARIEGNTVVLSHPDVKEPIAARYGWAWNPDGNLFNGAGLPASPFRTDDPGEK